jgi:N-acyl-D-amino-acid deacylase
VGAREFDLIIRGGTIVDGTGSPGFVGDVGVTGGRIVEVGSVTGTAERVIDASGLIVSPGFVDIHTHYDVQVFWDPYLTVSPMHGVTTVLAGNCGFGVAPTRPEHRVLLLRTLENVEGMPFECTSTGLGLDWPFVSYSEYLDAVDATGCAVNMAFFVGHTPVRTWVMGEEASEREATPDELDEMKRLVVEAMRDGAWGFSTSVHPSHTGYKGRPVPSRLATVDELITLVSGLTATDSGVFETNKGETTTFDALRELMQRTGRPVSFSGVTIHQGGPDGHVPLLEGLETLAAEGLPITFQMSALPTSVEFSMARPYLLTTNVPGVNRAAAFLDDLFNPVLDGATPESTAATYRDPAFRTKVIERTSSPGWQALFERMSISDAPGRPELVGTPIAELATAGDKAAIEVLFDVAVDCDLQATFTFLSDNADDAELSTLFEHPLARMGLTDGGAHMAQICDARYPTFTLAKWVRETGTLTLERAVQKMTSETADLYGFTDRGRLSPGHAADVTIFDADKVDAGPLQRVEDLPAGASRLYSEPVGVEWVIVNGTPIYEGTRPLLDRGHPMPGGVLRNPAAVAR